MKKDTTITVKYRDITEIVYDEEKDKWVFTLRGRERSAESLGKAKEIIDKPEPKNKKPFERVKCIGLSRHSWVRDKPFEEFEVTSIAEGPGYGRVEVWTSSKANGREKRNADGCYPATPANMAYATEYEAIAK